MTQASGLRAQDRPVWRNLHEKTFTYVAEPVEIDSMTAIVLSLRMAGDTGTEPDTALVSIRDNRVVFSPRFADLYGTDAAVIVSYRRLPVSLHQPYRRLDTTIIRREVSLDYIGFSYNTTAPGDPLMDFRGMDYSGSFSRGFSFGNRQDLVLNSSLNLQLAGKLGNDLEILAAISDNAIPIQPEGNTQQLQEFDRIYIQISKGRNSLRAGDFEIGRPPGYFIQYFKRSQGVMLQNEVRTGGEGLLRNQASLAISKGKFRRQIIPPIEGNQGPYKLTGNDGETFIIVLANTERVYLDGQLLRRGLELDYVIDYNRGEVQFTARRLITKEVRIIVEFEYTDQNYLRSMYTVSSQYTQGKWGLQLELFSEQDGKNATGIQQLSDEDKVLLTQIGDRLDEANISGIRPYDPEEGNTSAVLYERRDTILPDGRHYTGILVFSTDDRAERYTAGFTDLGEGHGHYVIASNLANGRVYAWSPPDPATGRPTGRYEPTVRIVTPKRQQMLSLGGSYRLSPEGAVRAELALSVLDLNRFSPLDDGDNTGTAARLEYTDKIALDAGGRWSISPELNYELRDAHFQAINPYRPAEFQRDWNTDPDARAVEHWLRSALTMRYRDRAMVRYGFAGFGQTGFYSGSRHEYDLSWLQGGFSARLFGSELAAGSPSERSAFSRPRIQLDQAIGRDRNWRIGLYGERERNARRSAATDELLHTSFYWNIGRVSLQSPEDKKVRLALSYQLREDLLPAGTGFAAGSQAQEIRAEGTWRQSKQSILQWTFTGRDLRVSDAGSMLFQPRKTFLGRINYQFSALKNVVRGNTAYELGSGQEPRLEFGYVEVRPGEGQYIWNDLNGDGIRQLDEFEIAPFADQANFVKVATVTSEFAATHNVLLNQQLAIDPRAVWFNEKGWKKWLGKLSLQTNVNLTRKALADADLPAWNPFILDFDDPSIITIASVLRNGVFFNRADPRYEVQWNTSDLRSRNLLTTGSESRRTRDNHILVRWNAGSRISLLTTAGAGRKQNLSEAFAVRNYDIRIRSLQEEAIWQPSSVFRSTLKLRYTDQANTTGELMEMARILESVLEAALNRSNGYVLRVQLTYSRIRFTGAPNSPVEFAMLEGLKHGNNLLWNLQLERKLFNNVQLQVSYEGRKTGENAMVHLSRMQIRATF